jgi:hypothetical protein
MMKKVENKVKKDIIKKIDPKLIIKKFADKLILRATEDHWEELDIANLILLISQELKFNSKSIVKFLNRTENGSSITFNHLKENGFKFSTFEIINHFEKAATDARHFIFLITDCLGYNLISMSDAESIGLVSFYLSLYTCN